MIPLIKMQRGRERKCAAQGETAMMINAKHKRIIALFICALFLAALMLSMAYVTKEADHGGIHDNCRICDHILMAQRTIDQLGSALLLIYISVIALFTLSLSVFHFLSVTVLFTPVALGVRMNN